MPKGKTQSSRSKSVMETPTTQIPSNTELGVIGMQGQSVGKVDANTLLFRFIKDNNIALNVEVLDEQASFAGDGFVLTDKPLLKITAKYKEAVNV